MIPIYSQRDTVHFSKEGIFDIVEHALAKEKINSPNN